MKLIKFLLLILIAIATCLVVWENYKKSHHDSVEVEKTEKTPHPKRKHPAPSTADQVQKAVKVPIQNVYIPETNQRHIKERHWYNAKTGDTTSRFNQDMTMQKLNELATKTINNGSQEPSKQKAGRKIHQYRFLNPIGVTSNGQQAHSLRVVTDRENKVITAFPVE